MKPETEPTDGEDAETDSTEPEKPKAPPEMKKQEDIRVVFVIKDGFAKQTAVKTGISSDTEWEIIEGVEDEDEIVSGSYRVLSKELKHDDEVKVDNSSKSFGQDEDEGPRRAT